MRCSVPILALATLFSNAALAHTTLQWFINDKTGSSGTQDCIRMPPNNNPIEDVTSSNMACNINGGTPAKSKCAITAGSTVNLEWHHTNREQGPTDSDDPIAASHKGPIITYMAKVDDAASVSNVAGLEWFKIQEDGLSGGTWAVDTFYKQKTGVWPTKIPSNIPDGDYLLRGEIIALHNAGSYPGAQFYMGCAQVTVSGGTGGSPSPTVKFPGAYSGEDPGVKVNIYNGISQYIIPGPAVYGGNSAKKMAKRFRV